MACDTAPSKLEASVRGQIPGVAVPAMHFVLLEAPVRKAVLLEALPHIELRAFLLTQPTLETYARALGQACKRQRQTHRQTQRQDQRQDQIHVINIYPFRSCRPDAKFPFQCCPAPSSLSWDHTASKEAYASSRHTALQAGQLREPASRWKILKEVRPALLDSENQGFSMRWSTIV